MSSRITKSFAPTPDGDIFVQEAGTGASVVVLLSVTSFGSALVDRALPLLAQRGHRALALDLMGYGRSDKREGDWPITRFATATDAALAALGVDRATLVTGHFAGLVGIELAARLSPRVERLVLDGTPYRTPEERAALMDKGVPAPTPWREDGSHAADHWHHFWTLIKRLNPDLVLSEQPDNRLRHAYLALAEVFAFGPSTLPALAGYPTEEKLPLLRDLPVLLLTSDTDWNRATQHYFTTALPDAEELIFPGIHPIHDIARPERAAEYVDVVDRFARGRAQAG